MTKRRSKRHTPEQIVRKLRDAEAMRILAALRIIMLNQTSHFAELLIPKGLKSALPFSMIRSTAG